MDTFFKQTSKTTLGIDKNVFELTQFHSLHQCMLVLCVVAPLRILGKFIYHISPVFSDETL